MWNKQENREKRHNKDKLYDHRINKHHIVWKQHKEEYNVFIEENIKTLRKDVHDAIHKLFTTADGPINEPHKQIEHLYNWLYKDIMSDEARELVEALLALWDRFYIEKLKKWKNQKKTNERN